MQTTLAQFNETAATDAFALQNPRLLRVRLGDSAVLARPGCIVARRGEATVEPAEPGLVRVTGDGHLYLADPAHDLHLVYLEGDRITVNARNLLAFEADIDWETEPLGADAASATRLHGGGWVVIASRGAPVLIDVGAGPTFAAAQAAIAWAAGVTGGPGEDAEAGELAFSGEGWLLVQPSRAGD